MIIIKLLLFKYNIFNKMSANFKKVVIIGDSQVGKTSIICRLIDEKFCDENETTI